MLNSTALQSPVSRQRLTVANLVANVAIVITGGAVRLTGSGLGCPTWPKCTEDSYVPSGALDVHSAIEFGNRMLSPVLAVIAIATVLVMWRTSQRRLALGIALGIPGQAVIGGLTVLTNLNPYVVGLHFLLSMGMIAAAHRLWRHCRPQPPDNRRVRPLAWALAVASGAVLVAGVLVTGSGPHAGDENAKRTGLNVELVAQVHVDAVFLLLGLTVAGLLAARVLRARRFARKVLMLLAISLGQGLIGFVQYFTGVPVILVGAHLAGACAVWLAALEVMDVTSGGSGASGASALLPRDETERRLVTV